MMMMVCIIVSFTVHLNQSLGQLMKSSTSRATRWPCVALCAHWNPNLAATQGPPLTGMASMH